MNNKIYLVVVYGKCFPETGFTFTCTDYGFKYKDEEKFIVFDRKNLPCNDKIWFFKIKDITAYSIEDINKS